MPSTCQISPKSRSRKREQNRAVDPGVAAHVVVLVGHEVPARSGIAPVAACCDSADPLNRLGIPVLAFGRQKAHRARAAGSACRSAPARGSACHPPAPEPITIPSKCSDIKRSFSDDCERGDPRGGGAPKFGMGNDEHELRNPAADRAAKRRFSEHDEAVDEVEGLRHHGRLGRGSRPALDRSSTYRNRSSKPAAGPTSRRAPLRHRVRPTGTAHCRAPNSVPKPVWNNTASPGSTASPAPTSASFTSSGVMT